MSSLRAGRAQALDRRNTHTIKVALGRVHRLDCFNMCNGSVFSFCVYLSPQVFQTISTVMSLASTTMHLCAVQ